LALGCWCCWRFASRQQPLAWFLPRPRWLRSLRSATAAASAGGSALLCRPWRFLSLRGVFIAFGRWRGAAGGGACFARPFLPPCCRPPPAAIGKTLSVAGAAGDSPADSNRSLGFSFRLSWLSVAGAAGDSPADSNRSLDILPRLCRRKALLSALLRWLGVICQPLAGGLCPRPLGCLRCA